jgi:hypothetical protein
MQEQKIAVPASMYSMEIIPQTLYAEFPHRRRKGIFVLPLIITGLKKLSIMLTPKNPDQKYQRYEIEPVCHASVFICA